MRTSTLSRFPLPVAILALASIVAACDSDSESADFLDTVETKIVADIPADPVVGVDSLGRPVGSGRATFFDLSGNTVVPASDSATANWDIGFRSTTILVNSGTSGPGSASAQVVVGVFEELAEAPVDGYLQDGPGGDAVPAGSGNGWYNYNPALNLITPIPGRFLVVKTSDGLYTKVKILSYYRGAPANVDPVTDEARYVTFEYVIQKDGSRLFADDQTD